MIFEEACESIIKEFGLIKNKRMAVLYGPNVGDFYCLCSTVEYVEKLLNMEAILLYHSDMQKEIVSWFEYGDYSIKGSRISEEVYSAIRGMNLELKKKYQDYLIFWNCGNEDFRKLTRNVSGSFLKNLKKPIFPYVDILQKYKEYIVPKRTVLIVPEARTVKSFPIWFWNFAAYIFEVMGYSVVFNVPSQSAKLYRGKSILIPISDVVGFANECGFVFGVRTGLFDVLSVSTARMVIFSSKSYKPLDRIFNIKNLDNRIKTIFYIETDPFFLKTDPISFIQKDFDDKFNPIRDMLYKICKSESENLSQEYPVNIQKSYSCKKMFNKYLIDDIATFVKPFGEFLYSYDILNEKMIFLIRNISVEKYRLDYKLFFNGKCLIELNNMHSNCLVYPLEQSGEYYLSATITDLENFDQECFETHKLQYSAPLPTNLKSLIQCKDLISYIIALYRFRKDITVFISSKDSHTYFKKTKNNQLLQNLRLLGLNADIEGTPRYSYIGIIDGGTIIHEAISEDKVLTYRYETNDCSIIVESAGYNVFKSPKTPIKIEINGENKAVNSRGLNFVVFDKTTKVIIDSVAFDTFDGNQATRIMPKAANILQSDNTPYQKNAYNDYLLDYMSELKCMRDTVLSLRASNERLEENLAKRLTEMKISLTETQHLQDKIDEFSQKNEQLIEKSICLEMERNTLSAELEQLRSQILDLRSSIKESTSEVNLLKKSRT